MKYKILILCILLSASSLFAEVEVIQENSRDRSPDLRTIPPKPTPPGIKVIVPNGSIPEELQPDAPVTGQLDPVIQTWIGDAAIPSTSQNFEGISAHGYMPPDTSGEAGHQHYVQVVNRKFAVFSKTGTLLYGPVNINTLWSGFGGLCETTNEGDPIVVYDQLANRWLISQFAYVTGGAHLECIAVSTTQDPTGSYYRYSYSFPSFNDYPKIGVWPDGYYATYILRNPDWSVVTSRICAYDRSKMIAGAGAPAQCFDVGKTNIALLPADLDGVTPPPGGSPHFSMNLSTTNLNLWKLKINWTSPANSTITGPVSIPVAAYGRACSPTRICVSQPGVTQKLDSFSDRLMFRLSYRNFGSHQSLVVNHSVEAGGGISGVRWYEIRNPNGTPVAYQQGTYSPDSNHRWMGSAASDLNGNIGLGYSISGNQVHPGIRYTGRLVTDPKGTLPQGEAVIMNGTGSQNGSQRWGDYSALTVDPTDDCTYWYTTEYIATTGSFNWRTRIASFKFPSCGCAIPAGVANNTAADVNQTADSGVNVTWPKDPGNWGDNAVGTRSYSVLRNGTAIASGLAYGSTNYTDTTGVNGQSYAYSVRYANGCGQSAVTAGISAADFVCSSSTQLLKNPGFESGRTLWTSSPATIINNSNGIYGPHSGSWKATLNGKGIINTASIYQQVTIPSGVCSATLSFWLRVATSEVTTTTAKDTLKVEVLNASGQVLQVLATYSNLNKSAGYLQKSLNLAPHAGKTVRIRFRGTENASRKTTFLVDTTSLTVVQ
jgi:hypothetical protein